MLYVALVTGKNLFHLIKPNVFFTYFPSECIEVHKLNEKFLPQLPNLSEKQQ